MPRTSRVRALVFAGLPWLLLLALVLRSPAVAALAAGWAAMLLLAHRASRRRLRGVAVRREVYANAFEGDAVASRPHDVQSPFEGEPG